MIAPRPPRRLSAVLVLGLILVAAPAFAQDFRPGDHISIIGNTMADRMQHDGFLEAAFQSRFPDHSLVIRNLGFSGDEVDFRLRSADFGTPDDWLTKTKTDVVIACFGYNESFAGAQGLDAFKAKLDVLIKHMLAQRYNGKSTPRVILISPTPNENNDFRSLPPPSANNARLKLYTAAMAEIARANGVGFVDLFTPNLDYFASRRLSGSTINGVHLNKLGNRRVAQQIDINLFGPAAAKSEPDLEKIRQAVLDKNHIWFNRYRTVDGYSIFGGRADLSFVGGQTNRVVAQREMEVLDVMTANRDERIWAVAKGKDLAINDDNTAPFLPVTTNKPGSGPNGTHLFLGGEEAIGRMKVAPGLKVNLFASEETFPELAKPVQMSFDAKGRLWVACWPTYPHWKPKEAMDDKILILEDTDGDGKADKRTIFADGLHCPTGFEFAKGGILVAQAPDLMFLKDTDGDDKADVRSRVLSGLDSADTHHASNSFQLDPGGALYFQEGTFHQTQVETPYGPPVRCSNAGVFRYEPKTQKFEVYVSYGFANPHGHAFDRWGQDVIVDGTGANPYNGTLFSGRVNYPDKHQTPPQVYQQRTRPCSGIEILASRHFPEEFQGNLLVANVIGFQGILRYRLDEKDSSLAGTELEPLLSSTDPSFRPADIEVGPDGAIYFLDWINPIIGHMQHNLRDPSRDRYHGRVYRITHEGRALSEPAKIAEAPIPALLDLLKSPEDRVRYRAKVELGARLTADVMLALFDWVATLDPAEPNVDHHLLEALWVHQYHDDVDLDLLDRVLKSSDFHARAAATRVLCVWRDRVPDAMRYLRVLAADNAPRVRLEAVRAASFFDVPEAVEVPLISLDYPTDVYLDYTRGETMKTLEPIWKKELAAGKLVAFKSKAGARFFLGRISTTELLKMPGDVAVCSEILRRKDIRDDVRREAVIRMGQFTRKSDVAVLLDAIGELDKSDEDGVDPVIFDLARILTALGNDGGRHAFGTLATQGRRPVTRQVGYLALIATEGKIDDVWNLASKSPRGLRDLADAMPMIRDPGQRAALYPKILALLDTVPAKSSGGTEGRYVRIELKGRKTLTLAEVEVISDGRNVARKGKASQINMAYGGPAERAIDGNKSASYGDGGQTHTEEQTSNPWWEVDLGESMPIDSVIIYNRADGLGNRLDGFVVRILDDRHETVFASTEQPAPRRSATMAIGGVSPEAALRRSAMVALTTVRGKEAETFRAIARFVRENGSDRPSAIKALLRIPVADWPTADALPLLDVVLAYVKSIPTADRTSSASLDALQFGDSLASLLPPERSKAVRKELGALGVRVIRVGTVTDRMLFDKDRLAVGAGKAVEVVFENTDIMPHNFVVAKPGSLEEVGLLAESTSTQPGAVDRGYVPQSDKILVAGRLLAPRESEKISFTAPITPGVYPYVCTYPGHWRRMFGALYVVEDLEAYLADPTGYLASHPLLILDDLLKGNRPRKEWTFDDLASSVAGMSSGRSFASGKQIFEVASCVSCHRLNEVGAQFGPDLATLDPRTAPREILRSLVEPSAKIDDKFATHVIVTKAGKTVTGMILDESPTTIKLIENPLAKSDPIIVEKADIEERSKSTTSIMPKGLLDKLTRDEILDLIAYLIARGDAKSPLFHDAHAH